MVKLSRRGLLSERAAKDDNLYSYASDGQIFTPVELSQDQKTLKPGLTHPETQQFRIEALRAASRVMRDANPHLDDVVANTIYVAEQFARWLEMGDG